MQMMMQMVDKCRHIGSDGERLFLSGAITLQFDG